MLHAVSYMVFPPSSSNRTNFLLVQKEPFSPREVRDDLLWEDYTHISLFFRFQMLKSFTLTFLI